MLVVQPLHLAKSWNWQGAVEVYDVVNLSKVAYILLLYEHVGSLVTWLTIGVVVTC